MCKRLGLTTAVLILTVAAAARPLGPRPVPRIYWDLVRIGFTPTADSGKLAGAGFEIVKVLPDRTVLVPATESGQLWLRSQGFRFEVYIRDYGAYLARRNRERAALAGADSFAPASMGGYFSPLEAAAFVDSLIAADTHGIISQRFEIGRSWWDQPLWMVRVSDNASIDEDEPEVFYNSLVHSREAMSLMTLLYFLRHLAENYGRADSVTDLVNSRELYFLPIFNPDGYEVNWQQYHSYGSFGLWRKNARDSNGNGKFDDPFDGVDLNRNFNYMWGYDNIGSSPVQSVDNYRGPEAFSEPETRAVRDFVSSHRLSAAVNFHTYGEVLINPFGYFNLLTPDSIRYRELGTRLTVVNGYRSGNAYRTLYYPVNGEMTDWMYGDNANTGKVFAWAAEVGREETGFWPPPDQIAPIARLNLHLNFTLARLAGFWPEPGGLQAFYHGAASENVTLRLALANPGLRRNREPVTLRVESAGCCLIPVDSTAVFPELPAGSPPVLCLDSLVFVFREAGQDAVLRLGIYEGEQRLRTLDFTLTRPGFLAGDLNRNSKLDIFDLLTLLRVISGKETTPETVALADLDCNGKVNIFDILELLVRFKKR